MKKYKEIDALVELLREVLATNPELEENGELYESALTAANKIACAIKASNPKAKFVIEPDALLGTSLVLSVTASLIVLDDIMPIVEGLQYAETMEMVVLKNGKIEFNVSFQDAYRIKIS